MKRKTMTVFLIFACLTSLLCGCIASSELQGVGVQTPAPPEPTKQLTLPTLSVTYNTDEAVNNGLDAHIAAAVKNTAGHKTPVVPQGFTHVTGEWDTGFVIRDGAGNEFVWIPVDWDTVELGRYFITYNEGLAKTYYNRYGTDYPYEYTETGEYVYDFIDSVAKYGGYYIGRYESSIEDSAVCVKAGVYPASDMTSLEMEEAAHGMAEHYGYSGAVTELMNSFAWDTAMVYMTVQHDIDYVSDCYAGNRSGKLAKTGEYEDDMCMNIADLCSNLFERTTETDAEGRYVDRGKTYDNDTDFFAGARSVCRDGDADIYTGFRVLMYLH